MAFERLTGKKVFINGVHAGAEYDFGLVCKHFGIECVAGNSSEPKEDHLRIKPRIPGWEIPQISEETLSSITKLECNGDEFKDADFIFIVNPADFQERMPYFSGFKPVIMYLSGQWISSQLLKLIDYMNHQYESAQICNIAVCCYSKAELTFLKHELRPELHGRVGYVSFFKKLEEYPFGQWDRREHFVYTSTHSPHRRGKFGKDAMFPEWIQVAKKFDIILSGMGTEDIGGLGCLPFEELVHRYQTCRCYVTVPAWPAPLVINLAEAMLCGAPVAFFDNDGGAQGEGIFEGNVGCLSSDPEVISRYVAECLASDDFCEEQSELCAAKARDMFDFDKNVTVWGSVLDSLLNETILK